MALAASYPQGTPMLAADVFAGQVAVITEANDPIGQAIAAELSRGGAKVVPLEVDVRDAAAVKRAFDAIEAANGPISILVNHFANRADAPVEVMSVEAWQDITHRVLDGTFNTCRELGLRRIADGRPATVVNGGTPYDITGGAGRAAAVAAGAGVMNLTKSLAVEWAPYDIRVNGIAPGYVAGSEAGPVSEGDLAVTVPGGRLCEPHEVAWFVAYMCCPFAAYLTGHTFVLDGASWQRPGRSPPLFEPIRDRYDAALKG